MSRIQITPATDDPLQQGRRDFRGCLATLAGACLGGLVVAALAIWDGMVGRVVIGGLGFGVAGFTFPWFAGSEPRTDHQTRFMLLVSAIGTVVGIVLGVLAGLSEKPFPWWAYLAAGAPVVIAGAWAGRRLHRGRRQDGS